jgi:hypothetical protein
VLHVVFGKIGKYLEKPISGKLVLIIRYLYCELGIFGEKSGKIGKYLENEKCLIF